MAFVAELLATLDKELAGCRSECEALAETHRAWLTETVDTNCKKLQYQTCARARRRGGGGQGGGRSENQGKAEGYG